MPKMIPPRQIPSLILATTFTFGGLWPLWSTSACKAAMRDFGLPPRIIESSPAQSVMKMHSSRMTVTGLALAIFHYRRMYASIDVVMLCLGWAGVVDGYVCWSEGVANTAFFRFVSGMIVSGIGAWGLWAGS